MFSHGDGKGIGENKSTTALCRDREIHPRVKGINENVDFIINERPEKLVYFDLYIKCTSSLVFLNQALVFGKYALNYSFH